MPDGDLVTIDTSKQYFCCQSVHIKKGAYFVAIVYAIIIVSNLGIRALKSEEVEWNWQLLFLVSDSVAVLCLFYGIVTEHAAFLQPFTVVSIVSVSFCILLTVFYSTAVYDANSYAGEQIEILLADKILYFAEMFSIKQKTVISRTALIGTLVYAIIVVVHSWFMLLVVRCAQYFRVLQSNKDPPSITSDDVEPLSSEESSSARMEIV